MAESTRIPHLLNAYLQSPPEASLILLSNVLNATSNWLILRYLLLANKKPTPEDSGVSNPSIVFVSFLRDFDFWRDSSRKLGLDLNQAIKTKRLIYVDGLSKLFTNEPKKGSGTTSDTLTTITESSLNGIETTINQALATGEQSGTKPLLIIDGLDFILTSTAVTTTQLLGSLMTWREAAHSTIITASADGPLIHSQQTPLEIEHASFVSALIHQAFLVISTRLLATGAARDVSGVLQVARGGAVDETQGGIEIEGKEVLYFVVGDGGVKVFERGAA